MKNLPRWCRLAVVGFVALATHGLTAQEQTPVLIKGHLAHPTRVLVKVKPVTAASAHASTMAAQGLHATRGFELVPGLVVLDTDPQAQSMAAAATGATNAALLAAQLQSRIEALNASGLFEYVEPDYLFFADATPNDSAFTNGTLWGLRNTGAVEGTAGVDIDAVRAWDVTTGSADVIVGVIDSGIRYTHVDLAANMWRNPAEVAGNGLDDDGNGYVDDVFGINAIANTGNPMDDDGHGTHVAGTIGAAANNGQPHVGVAWQVRLMALKFLRADGGGATSDAIECVNYAVTQGAKILNNSWGGSPRSEALDDAIAAAKNQGVLFVAAAGNDGVDNDFIPHFPASYDLDNVISVAAINRNGGRASFSDFGTNTVDLGAPGVAIYSTGGSSDTAYDTFQGTSMAAPHVAGVAALLRTQFPAITLADLRARLLETTTPTFGLDGATVTGGRVNAYQALTASPSGLLKVTITPRTRTTLFHGRVTPIIARISDLFAVTGATVTGTGSGVGPLKFLDDGIAPDAVAGDGLYTTTVQVPAANAGFSELALTINASAPGKTTVAATVSYVLQAPPVNDRFADRINLSFTHGSVTTSNFGGTLEPGEPVIVGQRGGMSLWWTWTAPANTSVTLNTRNSTFDTLLGVYTGAGLNALTEIASNDDIHDQTIISEVIFDAVAGTTYQIVVDGLEGRFGRVTLSLATTIPPANDNFADAIVVSGPSFNVGGTTVNATRETGEPAPPNSAGPKSVWWKWTAPADGTMQVWSHGFAQVAAYAGDSVDALTRVLGRVNEENGSIGDTVTFSASAGVTYHFAETMWDFGPPGEVTLTGTLTPPPANDRFANAATITGAVASVTGDNAWATREVGEPAHATDSAGATMWWQWTAPSAGAVVVTADASVVRAVVTGYVGSTVDALTLIGSSTDNNNSGRLRFSAAAGTIYHFAVDGRTSASTGIGSVQLDLLFTSTAPANDFFAARQVLVGLPVAVTGTNVGTWIEPGEPAHNLKPTASVWWTWTASADEVVAVSTAGSGFDATIAVYTGAVIDGLTRIGWSSGTPGVSNTALVPFSAVTGTAYQIVVDGYAGTMGAIVLSISRYTPPQIDVHASTQSATSGTDVVLTATVDGSSEPTFQWYLDYVALPNATALTLILPSAQLFQAGSYTVRVGGASGTSSAPVLVAVADPPPSNARLTNLSTRALALTGDNVLIPGFVVAGSGNKQLLIRAVGPTLATMGVTGTLPDPRLTLKRWNGAAYEDIASNDNWSSNTNAAAIITKSAELFAFPLNAGSADAALLLDLAPGQYSAVAGDAGTQTGIAIVELYDADAAGGTARLINISNRGFVGTGDNIMIPGYVVSDEGPKTLLIRAVGPTLSTFGVSGVLANPTLSIYRRVQGTEELILTNDDWSIGPGAARTRDVAAQIQAFALPEGSNDAAFVVTLNPGVYTVHARGANDTTGVALVEVYAVP